MTQAHILLAEDEEYIRAGLQDLLELFGYTVSSADNGANAWQMLQNRANGNAQKPYDLVISDVRMPQLDGVQLLERIRDGYPSLPVILITGHMEAHKLSRALGDPQPTALKNRSRSPRCCKRLSAR
jgi:CheY-like chemotaxis protein